MSFPADSVMHKIRAMLWPGSSNRYLALAQRPARLLYALTRDLLDEELHLRATSLVYTTLLSLVPLLALSFSVLKGFGVHNQLEPTLQNLFAPLGPRGAELTGRLLTFVDNVKVGVLGSVGLAFLILTVISLIQKVERAFNSIWQVSTQRGLTSRFSDYLSVVLIGPVLVFTALGATGTIMSSGLTRLILERTGTLFLLNWVGQLIPIVLLAAVFSFVYMFLPNTRVGFRYAACGGLTTALVWESFSRVFATFIAGSTNYTAIYSGFAILIVFMLWLYMSWLVVLAGCNIAFYLQHPENIHPFRNTPTPNAADRERISLEVSRIVAARFLGGLHPADLDMLTRQLATPREILEPVLDALCKGSFLLRICSDRFDVPAFIPFRSPESILVADLLDTIRTYGPSHVPNTSSQTERIVDRWADCAGTAIAGVTLADIAGEIRESSTSLGND